MDTRARGDTSEAAVVYAFTRYGLSVWLPQSRFGPCDLMVANAAGEIARVQVKSGRLRDDCVIANTRTTDHGRGRLPYVDHVDIIAIHSEDTGDQFVVPVTEAQGFEVRLRLAPTRNSQLTGVRFAADYKLADWARRFALTERAHLSITSGHQRSSEGNRPVAR